MNPLRALLAAGALSAAVPAMAGADADRAYLAGLQAQDARLQAVGWRLAAGNARFCDSIPSIGLLLQDMANYGEPARMRAASGIAGDVAVQAVVPGGPAAHAGLLPNDEIVSLAGQPTAALRPAGPGDWRRLTGLHDALDAALAGKGAVTVAWRDAAGTVHERDIAGVPVCPTRFELLDGGQRAAADGRRVVIGRDFAGFGYAEDELAAALAHELAHNLLAHRAWLKGAGRKQKTIRITEREADRLMPWLLANAGYDPAAAVRFFERWGPRHDGGLLRARSHDGWDERAGFARAELAEVRAALAERGAADWRARFRRDTGR